MTTVQTVSEAVVPAPGLEELMRRPVREVRADGWLDVCGMEALLPERGVAALVGDHQVAIFRRHDNSVTALDNVDPFTIAGVLSRGLVGSRGGLSVVTSPLHKQAFDLDTGHCLDDDTGAHDLVLWPVRIAAGRVLLGVPNLSPPGPPPAPPTA